MKTTNLIFLGILLSICLTSGQQRRLNKKTMQQNQQQLQLVSTLMGLDQNSEQIQPQPNITDIDGNEYRTVKFKGKTWMIDKLRVRRYNNGDSIKYTEDQDTWIKSDSTKLGMCCTINNNGTIQNGLLYNYYCIFDKRGLTPKGWHVATVHEWFELIDEVTSTTKQFDGDTYYILKDIAREFNLDNKPGYRDQNGEFKGEGVLGNYWLYKDGLVADKNKMMPTASFGVSELIGVFCLIYGGGGDFARVGSSILCVKDDVVITKSNNTTTSKTVQPQKKVIKRKK